MFEDDGVMAEIPTKLQEVLADFQWITDRQERADYLIELADQLQPVPDDVATRPYPEENHVDFCESDAYVWAQPREDGTLKFYFAVENPQGLSAMAMSAILDQTLSGQPLAQVAAVKDDIVFDIFGKNISMGKGQGLMGIVAHVRAAARQQLSQQSEQ
jgi:cysteine desulfuration protein SufE